jgi:hypothetical protein
MVNLRKARNKSNSELYAMKGQMIIVAIGNNRGIIKNRRGSQGNKTWVRIAF